MFMDLYSLIIENRLLLEFFYSIIIASICIAIVFKADKYFRLSLHQGLRYFRNAFFFYGIAFIARYIYEVFSDYSINYASIIEIAFEYFLIMAGFFLFYSLVWKKFETKESYSSLFNSKILIFHIAALILAVMDYLLQGYYFLFLSQIVIFIYASIISYLNYRKNRKHEFPKFYFIAMLMSLLAWILNLLAAFYFNWDRFMLISIGVINVLFFLLFLYGVIKATKK